MLFGIRHSHIVSKATPETIHVSPSIISFPLIFPFAATARETMPQGEQASCPFTGSTDISSVDSPSMITLSNIPTAHAGNASTFSVIVATWFFSPFFDAVNVTVYAPAFAIGTP